MNFIIIEGNFRMFLRVNRCSSFFFLNKIIFYLCHLYDLKSMVSFTKNMLMFFVIHSSFFSCDNFCTIEDKSMYFFFFFFFNSALSIYKNR